LQVIPEHFAAFQPENRYTAARFRKLVRANWKIAQEAFMESYHIMATHPEALDYGADSQVQYDIWTSPGGSVGRNAQPTTVPSMLARPEANMHDGAAAFALALRDWHYPGYPLPTIDRNQDARRQAADWHRAAIEYTYGVKMDMPDSFYLDSSLYFVFPHCCFWLCESLPFTYQFTPHATDPEQSYFEVRMLLPCPAGKPRPPSAPVVEVSADEKIHDRAPAFSFLGYIFEQDMSNMPLIQRGAHAAARAHRHTNLGRYQEFLIQHWNAVIDHCMARR